MKAKTVYERRKDELFVLQQAANAKEKELWLELTMAQAICEHADDFGACKFCGYWLG